MSRTTLRLISSDQHEWQIKVTDTTGSCISTASSPQLGANLTVREVAEPVMNDQYLLGRAVASRSEQWIDPSTTRSYLTHLLRLRSFRR